MFTQRPCAICGESFPSRSIRNKYCSERCKLTANNHVTYKKLIAEGRCASCHHPKPDDGFVVCADCRAGARERYIKRKPESKPYPCTVCGTLFNRNSTNAKYCSAECRKHEPTGLCPRCKKQPSNPIKGYKLCSECRDERQAWWRHRTDETREIALENQRLWRDRHTGYYKEVNAKSNLKIKIEVFSHYGGVCVCCGEIDLHFLTIDHIHGNGTEHRKSIFNDGTGGARFWRWMKKNGFPDDYQVLCYNCNIGRYKCGGVCPHKLDQI